MCNIIEIADLAQIVVNGYAFTKEKQFIRVLNLNNPQKAAVINENFEMIETSMSDIEWDIVIDYLKKNIKYMEV